MAVNLSPIWGAGAQLLDNSGNVLTGGKIYTYLAGTTTPATTYTSSNGATANSNPIILNSAGRVPYEIWLTDSIEYKFVLKDSNDTLIGTWDNLVGINSNFINYYGQQEIQTATAGQTVFTLVDFEYQPGTGNLSVFVDGVNQYGPGAQYAYVETDASTVTFVSGLHVGASVKFTTTKLENPGVADASQVSYTYPDSNAVTQNVEERLAQYVSVKDFGAVGDGVTDDTAAIQNAIDAVEANGGGIVFIPVGNYKVTATLSTSSAECPITICGEGAYTTAKGTSVSWYGGNAQTVFQMPGYGVLKDLYIENSNASTSVAAVGYAGTSAIDNRAYGSVSGVIAKQFYVGFFINYAWNINFYNTKALYCDIGYSVRTEANALTFTGCQAGVCGVGITDDGGTGAKGIVWTGGSIELSTTAGIKYDSATNSSAWVFNGVYFEANYRTALLAKDITISDPFINGDGGSGTRPAIQIAGSRGIIISGVYEANVTSLFEFTGSDANYVGNSVYVTSKYSPSSVQNSIYDNSDGITFGWLDPSCYIQIQTNFVNANAAQIIPVSIVGMNYNLRERKLIAAKLVVNNQIVVSGTATFSVGYNGPSYNNLATSTFSTNLSAGVYDIPLASGAATDYYSNTYSYFATGTAETSGDYAFLLYFA